MNIFKKNNEKKTTQKLPMTGKVRKGFRAYCAVIYEGKSKAESFKSSSEILIAVPTL